MQLSEHNEASSHGCLTLGWWLLVGGCPVVPSISAAKCLMSHVVHQSCAVQPLQLLPHEPRSTLTHTLSFRPVCNSTSCVSYRPHPSHNARNCSPPGITVGRRGYCKRSPSGCQNSTGWQSVAWQQSSSRGAKSRSKAAEVSGKQAMSQAQPQRLITQTARNADSQLQPACCWPATSGWGSYKPVSRSGT